MNALEMSNLIGANARRAVMENQIAMARSRFEELLLVGYAGGLFEASDSTIAGITIKSQRSEGWGIAVIDKSGIPIYIAFDKVNEFLTILSEANAMAHRQYLMEYTEIINATKREMIEGDL